MLENSNLQSAHTKLENLSKADDLSWKTVPLLNTYLDLFELSGNETYLQKFTAIADKIITLTDQKLGRRVSSGESLPAWSRNAHQTLSYPKVLYDQNDQPSLEVRAENWAFNELFEIRVTDGTNPGTFKLTVTNHYDRSPLYKKYNIHDNLTMNDFGDETLMSYLKFKKLGLQRPKNIFIPKLETKRHINLHTTGDVATVLARYSFLSPRMSDVYRTKAPLYRKTAINAVYVHDTIGEWIDKGTYGYYIFNSKGAFWADEHVYPYNYTAAVGKAFLYLYKHSTGTEKEKYRKRLNKIAKGFMYCPPGAEQSQTGDTACMTHIVNGNKYSWPYGYMNGYELYNIRVEILEYGPIDLDFLYLLIEEGFLPQEDGVRFANTVYDMVKNTDKIPPTFATDVLGRGSASSTNQTLLVRSFWGMVPYARYRRDIFDKARAMYDKLSVSKYYGVMSTFPRYYSAITQMAMTAEKNGYWQSNPLRSPTPSITVPVTTTATATVTPTRSPPPSVTATVTIAHTPTPQPVANSYILDTQQFTSQPLGSTQLLVGYWVIVRNMGDTVISSLLFDDQVSSGTRILSVSQPEGVSIQGITTEQMSMHVSDLEPHGTKTIMLFTLVPKGDPACPGSNTVEYPASDGTGPIRITSVGESGACVIE